MLGKQGTLVLHVDRLPASSPFLERRLDSESHRVGREEKSYSSSDQSDSSYYFPNCTKKSSLLTCINRKYCVTISINFYLHISFDHGIGAACLQQALFSPLHRTLPNTAIGADRSRRRLICTKWPPLLFPRLIDKEFFLKMKASLPLDLSRRGWPLELRRKEFFRKRKASIRVPCLKQSPLFAVRRLQLPPRHDLALQLRKQQLRHRRRSHRTTSQRKTAAAHTSFTTTAPAPTSNGVATTVGAPKAPSRPPLSLQRPTPTSWSSSTQRSTTAMTSSPSPLVVVASWGHLYFFLLSFSRTCVGWRNSTSPAKKSAILSCLLPLSSALRQRRLLAAVCRSTYCCRRALCSKQNSLNRRPATPLQRRSATFGDVDQRFPPQQPMTVFYRCRSAPTYSTAAISSLQTCIATVIHGKTAPRPHHHPTEIFSPNTSFNNGLRSVNLRFRGAKKNTSVHHSNCCDPPTEFGETCFGRSICDSLHFLLCLGPPPVTLICVDTLSLFIAVSVSRG
ncbi:hypothetical protein B296_00016544 [Ensete ventricosum]|uniref:Uncharacterized protein n=1 Tax=Ensete ventricosum TaxID=4639 RepID=A0A426ZFC7_ENSVE|nr:hypothetical protein B296_00016544 [Ensete ventricosum]